MVNWLVIIVLGVLLGVASAIFDLSFLLVTAILVGCAIFMIGRMYYIGLYSTNMKAVRKYIEKHKKEPAMNFFLVVENGTKEEEIKAIDEIIATAKNDTIKRTYEMNKALRLEDFDQAEEIAQSLENNEYGKYGLALVAANRGQYDEAEDYSFFTIWMKYAVQAEIAYHQKDKEKFKQYANDAIQTAKGVQRFVLVTGFKKAELEQVW